MQHGQMNVKKLISLFALDRYDSEWKLFKVIFIQDGDASTWKSFVQL